MMRNCWWLVATLVAVVSTQDCYFPDGTKTSTTKYKYESCAGVNTTWNSCCVFDEGDICQPSGLCTWPNNYDYRGGCTNKDWEGCYDMCPGDKKNAWVQVRRCAGNEYCCDPDNRVNCCDNKSARFILNNTGPTGDKEVKPVPVRPSAYTVTISSSPESATADSLEADSSESPAADSSDNSTNNDDNSSSSSSNNNAGAIAGGVVGGVVGLALVGVLAWFLFRKEKQSKTKADDESTHAASSTPAMTNTPPPVTHSPNVEYYAPATKVETTLTSPSSEVDAGPESVRAESDSRPIVAYEMPAHMPTR